MQIIPFPRLPSSVIAKPRKGLWQSASTSHVPRKPPRGIPQGAEPLGRRGRDSQGDRPCTGPLERISLVTFFGRSKKVTRRRRRDRETNCRSELRIRNTPGESPAAVVPKTRRGLFALRRDPVSFSGKETGKRNRQREPIPKAVPFGILPHRPGGCGPLEIPRGFTKDDGQGTKDEGRSLTFSHCQNEAQRSGFILERTFRRNLQAATKGSCAVFRRIRTTDGEKDRSPAVLCLPCSSAFFP